MTRPTGNPSKAHTFDEVADLLGVCRSTVVRLVDKGDLIATDIKASGTRPRLRISDTEVARFIASRTITPHTGVGTKAAS